MQHRLLRPKRLAWAIIDLWTLCTATALVAAGRQSFDVDMLIFVVIIGFFFIRDFTAAFCDCSPEHDCEYAKSR